MNVAQALRTHFNCKNEAPINSDCTLFTFIEIRPLYAKFISASNALLFKQKEKYLVKKRKTTALFCLSSLNYYAISENN